MYDLSNENKKWVDEIWTKLDAKLSRTAVSSYEKIPYTTVDGVHNDDSDVIFKWTNGFWPGLMWLMYVGTKNEVYKKTAEHAEEMLDAALAMPEKLSHDVGFMWHISSGINYRLFGGEKSRARTLHAANFLAARYNIRGNYIRVWNGDRVGQVIIDCMMNLPLLYWASEVINDNRYRYIAEAHADNTIKTHIRPDGSVRHIVDLDPTNGDVKEYIGGQGYDADSAWSRGQAWAIYGYALSYIHTGKEEYLDIAKRVANYFIANVADTDYLPRVDFKSPCTEYDTTAGAAAACGLLEIAKCVGEHEKGIYLNAALRMLKALEKNYCDWSETEDSILQHGVEKYHPIEQQCGKPIIYGDYYFAEAIYKLKGFDTLFW